MNPSVPDRLNSAVRALSCVVLPALPPEASLAREQLQLVIGHLQITLAQYADAPGFEAEESADFAGLAEELLAIADGGAETMAAAGRLRSTVDARHGIPPLEATAALQQGIDALLLALAADGAAAARDRSGALVLDHGTTRAVKDRKWFAMMGFDPDAATL